MSDIGSEWHGSGFGLENLPYGVDEAGHIVVAYDDGVVDLAVLEGLDVDRKVFASGSLNDFFRLGPEAWSRTRSQLMDLVPGARRRPLTDTRLILPWEVGDYADFYSSREHVVNIGRLLRPSEDPLPAAWLHLPMGYHGRAGTVVVSGSPIFRPNGVLGPARFGPTERLDVEVELGFVVGVGAPRGRVVTAAEAERHIFGAVLVNDWSARDIQAFEYRPLGPFLSKSFATSVSPWVVPLAALQPWRVEGPVQKPEPSGYLKAAEPRGFDVRFQLSVNGAVISSMSSSNLYWSAAQQLAHLTVNGAGVRAGDLFASGTISGSVPGSEGSLMERYRAERWLEDGDVVTIEGWCGERGGDRWLALGEVTGRVVEA